MSATAFRKQVWDRRVFDTKGCSGDIVFFREVSNDLRTSNMATRGTLTDGRFSISRIVVRFGSQTSSYVIKTIMDNIIVRLQIEGDDAYRFVRPTTSRFGFEFVYDCDVTLGRGQSFNTTLCFPKRIDFDPGLDITVILEGELEEKDRSDAV